MFANEAPEPMVYLSYFQYADNETTLQVRTQGDPRDLEPGLRRLVREVSADVPLSDVRPLYETTQISRMLNRIEALSATVFGLLALVLATTGVYGLVAYRAQLRTHEIGIRIALGASRSEVAKLVLSQGMWMTGAGLAVGIAVSAVLTRFLRGLLYGVSALDPLTMAGVTAMLAGIALVACVLPAVRATHIDPVRAIREE
jgi:ABC-type antimicrobial peptide transport system permease subunit